MSRPPLARGRTALNLSAELYRRSRARTLARARPTGARPATSGGVAGRTAGTTRSFRAMGLILVFWSVPHEVQELFQH